MVTLEGVFASDEDFEYDPDDPVAFVVDALPADFTRDQVEFLHRLAVDHLPFTVRAMDEKNLWLYDYLHQKHLLMKATPDVRSPFAWLRQAVAEDWR